METSTLVAPENAGVIRADASDSAAELRRHFNRLQHKLRKQFQKVYSDSSLPQTIVVIPSLSLDTEELSKISGVHHYEERLLCLLLLLRMPRTRLVYVTSQPIHPTIIDYFLHLLPGIPVSHARKRLTLLSCEDASPLPLSQKILDRPRLLHRIRNAVASAHATRMVCFNATMLEMTLSVRINVPLYAADPAIIHLGTKTGSRRVFQEAGICMPDGFEDLRDEHDIVEALSVLKRRNPNLTRAVVKLNDGFSGEGNGLFSFEGCPDAMGLKSWIAQVLPKRIQFEAKGETWGRYRNKFAEMHGIVEAFVEGDRKRSPSSQCRITPLGQVRSISTHDQVLGGPSGQIFLGCTFPADTAYRLEIQEAGIRVGEVLTQHGAIGRYSVDFISVWEQDHWQHYAIEINLRKGGTTHPFVMLQFLTGGSYDVDTGLYHTPAGQQRFYYASDNLEHPTFHGLGPDDLIDIAVYNNLHFDATTQEGVVFHLIGALSEFGKLGVVCIGESLERAQALYDGTVEVLHDEALQQEAERSLLRSRMGL